MPHISQVALVPYSCEQMFDLVNELESYPLFLKGCVGARYAEKLESYKIGELRVSKAGFNVTLLTRNTFEAPFWMKMTLQEGPFSSFTGEWRFAPLVGGCQVQFEADFEFDNPLLGFALNHAVLGIFGDIVQSFSDRAKVVYG